MSIVRVGLAETKKFAEGYDAIFGNKQKGGQAKKPETADQKAPAKKKTKTKRN